MPNNKELKQVCEFMGNFMFYTSDLRHIRLSGLESIAAGCIVRAGLDVALSLYPRELPSSPISVGYNDREMLLDGQFSYDNANQRALPFNVHINEISGDDRVHTGANSECEADFCFA